MTREQREIRQRATSAVLQKALLSWQMGVTVAFTLLLFALGPAPFDFWQNWLIGGGLAAGAFVLGTLTDEEAVNDAIARQFDRQFDLTRIKNRTSRQRLSDAMEYRRNMMVLAKRASGSLRMSLSQTVDDVNQWIHHMYDLAEHIDAFESDDLVIRDRRTVPLQLERTRQKLERETSENIKRDLERQVAQLEQQLAHLEATSDSIRRAQIQLETTLSSLATIYAQMARLGAKEVDSGRAQRIRLGIQDEITGLQDTIDAMDEVQSQAMMFGR
jgi:uncharacterized membrane protein YccC